MDQQHKKMLQEGQTSAPGREDSVDYHYVCFVNVEGQLLELDGRKKGPVVKGPCDKEWSLCTIIKLTNLDPAGKKYQG